MQTIATQPFSNDDDITLSGTALPDASEEIDLGWDVVEETVKIPRPSDW